MVEKGYIYAAIPPLFRITTKKNEYIYPKNNGKWTESRRLPREYSRYNLYSMYKVPIYEKNNPQRYNRQHINK